MNYAQLTASGPIVARTGQIIRGLSVIGAAAAAILIPEGVTDVLIEYCYLTAPGGTEFCRGVDIHPRASRITVRHCHIDDVSSGAYAAQARHPLVFENNLFTRIRGPLPRGQGIQFNGVVDGQAQSRIVGNEFDRATMVEDWINMFSSAGSEAYPVLIAHNRARGGGRRVLDAAGERVWDASGSGICLGDYGGGYFDVLHNLLVCTPNTGIGIAGAHDVRCIGNIICNAGENADSQTRSALVVNSYAGHAPKRITLRGNRAVARGWLGQGRGELAAGYWHDGTATDLIEEGNVWRDETLTPDIWDRTAAITRAPALLQLLQARASASVAKGHTPALAYAQAAAAVARLPPGADPRWVALYAARLGARAGMSEADMRAAADYATQCLGSP